MFGHQDEPRDQTVNEATSEPLESSSTDTTFSPTIATPLNPAADDNQNDSRPPSVPLPPVGGDSPDRLLDIKQQALQQLTPLVGHLEQSPEEKFRTTMMMIQAADNQDLIKDAYEAAQAITDEKARAQALLDIVNEINYFTQHAK